jgi:hypothetical protein
MASINKTPHYNLSQFGDSPDDKPSWRGDYTADMSKIDSQMYRNATDVTTAASTANTAKSTADNALSLAQTNKSDITEQESYFTALGVTSEPTAQALMSTINGKAENTALTALQGTVSGLSDSVEGKAENTALTALQGTVSSLSDSVEGKANSNDVYTKAQSDVTFTKQGGYSGTAQALNQQIGANTSNISSLRTRTETVESKVTHLTGSLSAVPKFGIWHGAGNTDNNASVAYPIPKTDNAQTINNIQVIPVTSFENTDNPLPLSTELWWVEEQTSRYVVHLRYRNIGNHAWASGVQPAVYMQAMYILTPC